MAINPYNPTPTPYYPAPPALMGTNQQMMTGNQGYPQFAPAFSGRQQSQTAQANANQPFIGTLTLFGGVVLAALGFSGVKAYKYLKNLKGVSFENLGKWLETSVDFVKTQFQKIPGMGKAAAETAEKAAG